MRLKSTRTLKARLRRRGFPAMRTEDEASRRYPLSPPGRPLKPSWLLRSSAPSIGAVRAFRIQSRRGGRFRPAAGLSRYALPICTAPGHDPEEHGPRLGTVPRRHACRRPIRSSAPSHREASTSGASRARAFSVLASPAPSHQPGAVAFFRLLLGLGTATGRRCPPFFRFSLPGARRRAGRQAFPVCTAPGASSW